MQVATLKTSSMLYIRIIHRPRRRFDTYTPRADNTDTVITIAAAGRRGVQMCAQTLGLSPSHNNTTWLDMTGGGFRGTGHLVCVASARICT